MSVRCTRPPTVRFTQVRNEWARDRRLGYKARGLLTYLHSHEDGYELSLAQIVRDGTDGKDAVKTGLDELEAAGYLTRLRARDDGGRWGETDYVLADPFDASGRLVPHQRETRASDAEDQRVTRQSGLSAPDNPRRIIRPLEDNGEKTRVPSEPPPTAGQLRLVEEGGDPFEAFWAAYPRKVSKDAARRAFGKASRRTDAALIVAAVRAYPFDLSRPQYIPHPATWLNGGRWEDDPAAVNGPRNVRPGAYGPYRNPDPATQPDAFSGSF